MFYILMLWIPLGGLSRIRWGISYIRISQPGTRMLLECTCMLPVCYSYVTRMYPYCMYPYVTCMLLVHVCTRMYRMLFVWYPYVTRSTSVIVVTGVLRSLVLPILPVTDVWPSRVLPTRSFQQINSEFKLGVKRQRQTAKMNCDLAQVSYNS